MTDHSIAYIEVDISDVSCFGVHQINQSKSDVTTISKQTVQTFSEVTILSYFLVNYK